MKIITGVPIYVNQNPTPSELYAGVDAKQLPKAPLDFSKKSPPTDTTKLSATNPEGEKRKGQFWDKAKGAWVKAKDSGLVDKGVGLFGKLFGNKDTASPEPVVITTTDVGAGSPEKKGMSKGLKIGLYVGGGLLLLGAIYMLTKKKGK
jgi:hypothetical protein